MKSIRMLLVLWALVAISSAAALKSEKMYFLDLEYDKGNIRLLDANLITGYHRLSKDETLPYRIELHSMRNVTIYEGFFDTLKNSDCAHSVTLVRSKQSEFLACPRNTPRASALGFLSVPNMIYAPPPLDPKEMSGMVELEKVNFSISLPCHKQGSTIKISKDRTQLLSVDVSEFSQYCDDSLCQINESSQTCPEDCVEVRGVT